MSEDVRDLLPVIPGFRIEREIGRGATSRVYLAHQDVLDRKVAIKVITTLGEKGRRRALRLFREARLAGALDHPGIVRGIDAGADEGFCWFAMEYVEGRTLEQTIQERGPLPLPRVLDIAVQVLTALDHAHRRGIVHRDIKPANVLLDRVGHARLLDLGLARRDEDPRLTDDTGSLGTPLYMSPEQAKSPERADARSDLFSLGATLYKALCGRAPFEGGSVTAVLTRLLYDEPLPPSALVADVPKAVDQVLLRTLAKEPRLRHPDAAALLSDVHALRSGRTPPSAALPKARGALSRSSNRRAAMIAAGLLAILGVAGWHFFSAGAAPEEKRFAGGPAFEGIETPAGARIVPSLPSLLPVLDQIMGEARTRVDAAKKAAEAAAKQVELESFRARLRARAHDAPDLASAEAAMKEVLKEFGDGDGADATVERFADGLVTDLKARAHARWDRNKDAVNALRQESRWRDARELLDSSLKDAVAWSVELAAEHADSIGRLIQAGAEADLRAVAEVRAIIRRAGADGLPPGEAEVRLEQMKTRLAELGRSKEQIEGAEEEWSRTQEAVSLVEAALSLRPALQAAAAAWKDDDGPLIEPVIRGEGRKPQRRLGGLTPDGEIRFLHLSNAAPYLVPVGRVAVATLLEVLAAAGGLPDRRAAALLAYLEGDDLEALALADAVEASWARDWIRGLADAGLGAKTACFDSAAERDAYLELARCRLLLAEGRSADARQGLEAIGLKVPKGSVPASSFWASFPKEKRGLIEEIERAEMFKEWEPLRPFFKSADSETGILRISLDLRDGQGAAALTRPAEAKSGSEGLEVPMAAEPGPLRPPPHHAPVRLAMPPLPRGDATLEFEIVFSGPEPVAFLAVGLHDLSFLGIDRLRTASNAKEPLHGLERSLQSWQRIGQAALWRGELKDYPQAFAGERSPFHLPPREPTRVRIEVRDEGRETSITVGKQRYTVQRGAVPKLHGAGLWISGWPAYVLRDLRLTVDYGPASKR